MTLGVRLLAFLLLHVELAEEVERQHSVQVDHDARQHERHHQLQQPPQQQKSTNLSITLEGYSIERIPGATAQQPV